VRRAPEPPRYARLLLELALPADDREPVTGDLLEVFLSKCSARGRVRARVWYWGQALSFSGRFLRERWRERGERDAAGAHVGPGPGNDAWPGRDRVRTHEDRRWDVGRMLEALARDLTHAARNLRRAPGFTAVTVVTLALAIGANTAIFSVVDRVLLKPLPFPHPDRLVAIRGSAPGSDLPPEFGSGTEMYVEYREQSTKLENLAFYQIAQTNVRSGDHVEHLFVSSASPSFFATLGVKPVVGRLPSADDEEGTVMVLSHWLWMDWFGGDPSVVGSTMEVAGALRTVIGVMGPDLRFPEERTSLWILDEPTPPIRPGGFGLNLVGRLAPGAGRASLTAELAGLARRLPERFGGGPRYASIIGQYRPVVRSLKDQLVGDIEAPLWILLGTVGVVLLIACANVADLLIVRAESRRRDLAVRRALGAGRTGLVRAQMAEALILAALGGVGGALLAWGGVPLLVHAAPQSIPGLGSVGLNTTALVFTAGLAIVAALVAGLLPAIRFSNPGLVGGLRESDPTGSRRTHLTRDVLVVAQTAAALVLLVSSGLLLQSFRALTHVDPGYDTKDIFTFQMAPDFRKRGINDGPTVARFQYMFMDSLAALPGVESVGLVNTLPLDEGAGMARFASEKTAASEAVEPLLHYAPVGGDYFQTMGISLLEGRYFERNDQVPAEVDAIVSRSAGQILWPGEDPLDKHLRLASDSTSPHWLRVVGVVEDIMLRDFREPKPDPMVYIPMVGWSTRAWSVPGPAYVVKTPRAESIAPEIRELIHKVVPDAPMYRIFTMAGLADRSHARLSFTMLTLLIAAGLALILGAVGLYGVLSYLVAQRTREIGIRMALGAQARQLRRMVVARGSRVTLVGVAVGVGLALLTTRILGSLLFGVRAIDVPTFVAMSGVMLGVALLASYMPARKASSVDPIRSLRAE